MLYSCLVPCWSAGVLFFICYFLQCWTLIALLINFWYISFLFLQAPFYYFFLQHHQLLLKILYLSCVLSDELVYFLFALQSFAYQLFIWLLLLCNNLIFICYLLVKLVFLLPKCFFQLLNNIQKLFIFLFIFTGAGQLFFNFRFLPF